MTQKLATANNGTYPLDFGSITFDGPKSCMVVHRGTYRNEWTDFKAGDVTLSDVADDYEIPVNAVAKPISSFTPLTPGQFVGLVAAALGPTRSDQLFGKSLTVQKQIDTATIILRDSAATLGAIAYLKTGINALTDAELTAVDALWATK